MAQQSKTPDGPVALEAATKIFDRMMKEKLAKGYRKGEDAAPMATITPTNGGFTITRKPCPTCGEPPLGDEHCCGCNGVASYKPMLLNSITDPEPYIESNDWLMQEKADGVRAIAHISAAEVKAYSRTGLPVAITKASAQILARLFAGCIIDVEVIGEQVVLFDLLSHHGADLRSYSCADRLKALASKFPKGSRGYSHRNDIVKIIHTERTYRTKREMLAVLHCDGAEGVVFKLASAPYIAGRANSGGPALKLKFKKKPLAPPESPRSARGARRP